MKVKSAQLNRIGLTGLFNTRLQITRYSLNRCLKRILYLWIALLAATNTIADEYADKRNLSERDRTIKAVFDQYEKQSARDIQSVPKPERSLIMIYTAHAIIRNGGFRYFFEQDFSGGATYESIAICYREIGFPQHSDEILKLIQLFPEGMLDGPKETRWEYLEQYFEPASENYLPEVDTAESLFFKETPDVIRHVEDYYLQARGYQHLLEQD